MLHIKFTFEFAFCTSLFLHYFCGMLPILFFPFVAAIIGWLANRIFSAILRANLISDRNKLVKSLAELSDGFWPNDLSEEENAAFLEGLRPQINNHVNQFIEEKLPKRLPALAMFSGDKMMEDVKAAFLEEVDLLMPHLLQNSSVKPAQVLKNRLQSMPHQDFVQLLNSMTKKLFYQFQLFGAAMGFVIGIVFVIMVFVYYYLFLS